MTELGNLESSKIFPAQENNPIIEWNQPDILELDIISNLNNQVDSEINQKLNNFEAFGEYERILKNQNIEKDDHYNDIIGYDKMTNLPGEEKGIWKNFKLEPEYLNNLNGKQKEFTLKQGYRISQMIIDNNIKNCYMNNGSPLHKTKENISNSFSNTNEHKSLQHETHDFNTLQIRKSSEDILSYSNLGSANNIKREKIFISEKKLVKKNKSFDQMDLIKNQLGENIENIENFSQTVVGPNSEKNESNQQLKLLKNRLSAQKSRLKKKMYIKSLEAELLKSKEELKYFKTLSKTMVNPLEQTFKFMESKEKEYLKMKLNNNKLKTTVISDELSKIKTEHKLIQDSVVFDLFKTMVKTLIPLELKYYENTKFLNLTNMTNFDNLDILSENIMANQLQLSEMSNFQLCGKEKFSFPLKIYLFLEQLKFFTIRFREFLLEMNNINIFS